MNLLWFTPVPSSDSVFFNSLLFTPYDCNLVRRVRWLIVSKALLRSTNTVRTRFPRSTSLLISSISKVAAKFVDLFDR